MVKLGSTPVLDIGSFSVKAGFAGESYPLVIVTNEQINPWPITRGKITDWKAIEGLLMEVWVKLRVESKEEEVIYITPSGTPATDREKLEKLLFETFNIRYLTFLPSCICSLNAAGLKTGIVVDIGYGVTRICTIIDGIEEKLLTVDLGGADIDRRLKSELKHRYPNMCAELAQKQVRELKEKHCFVSLIPETETAKAAAKKRYLNKECVLQDGTSITLDRERALPYEVLFEDVPGSNKTLAELIHQAIQNNPRSKALAVGIVLVGGSTVPHNIQFRLLAHLWGDNKEGGPLRIHCPPHRLYTTWSGASIIYFDNDYVDRGISYNEYCNKAKITV